MKLDTSRLEHDVLVISTGEQHLDAGNAAAFKDAMLPLLESRSRVVFDMSGLRFVDSSGLGALIFCLRTVAARQGEFRLCNLDKPVQSLFELMRMHRVFSIHASCDDAVRSFA